MLSIFLYCCWYQIPNFFHGGPFYNVECFKHMYLVLQWEVPILHISQADYARLKRYRSDLLRNIVHETNLLYDVLPGAM